MNIPPILSYFTLFFGSLILFYMLIVITAYTIMLILSFFYVKKRIKLDHYLTDEEDLEQAYSKPVSIIIPAYNEGVGIIDTVHSLLSLSYPQTEILVIDDGSEDDTQEKMIERFRMKKIDKVIRNQLETSAVIEVFQSTIHENVLLITKENGGKSDALNVGVNAAMYPYFCSIDGDSILEKTSLLRVMKPVVSSNGEVIAAGGSVRIANGSDIQLGAVLKATLPKNTLVIMQVIEYLRAFFLGRIALSKFNLVLIISGAFSVFSKEWVIEAGGFSKKTTGEDMEMVVRLHRLIKDKKSKKRIEFVADPVCWTEAPEDMKGLRRQRRRWHQGLIGSLWQHKRMTLNPKYGFLGMVSFPYFWFIECFGPIIELGGYLYFIISLFLGDIYFELAMLLALLFILYGCIFSIAAVLLEAWSINSYPKISDVFKMILLSFTEVFWYRPLTLIWRLEGFLFFLIGRNDWGHIERKGLSRKKVME